jgi:transcriptional regulator with XRE-family HTH domain
MRRKMLSMSQQKLGSALGLSFQQIQKYEKGANRISVGRLQQIARILQVPIAFFYEGALNQVGASPHAEGTAFPEYMSEFMTTTDGLVLSEAFVRIESAKLRKSIIALVQQIADEQKKPASRR